MESAVSRAPWARLAAFEPGRNIATATSLLRHHYSTAFDRNPRFIAQNFGCFRGFNNPLEYDTDYSRYGHRFHDEGRLRRCDALAQLCSSTVKTYCKLGTTWKG